MLTIFNNLKPFFEDNYRRIHVREYAKLMKLSPPTASKYLEKYHKMKLLQKETEFRHNFYFADRENELFIDISRVYWKNKFKPLTKEIKKRAFNPIIILFGSLAKAEVLKESDVDIAVFGAKVGINIEKFERMFKREIQIFEYSEISSVKNRKLLYNILNGYQMSGRWTGELVSRKGL